MFVAEDPETCSSVSMKIESVTMVRNSASRLVLQVLDLAGSVQT